MKPFLLPVLLISATLSSCTYEEKYSGGEHSHSGIRLLSSD
jgi:hypothetical protein